MTVVVLSILVNVEGEYLETSSVQLSHQTDARGLKRNIYGNISLCVIVRRDTGAEISQTAIDGL